MVTKEMVLAGLENNMVHVGAYMEGGVTQDLQKSIDELACSIGEYSFFFATGDEYESIQDYLNDSTKEEVAQDITEAIQCIHDELNPTEADYYEATLREGIRN